MYEIVFTLLHLGDPKL